MSTNCITEIHMTTESFIKNKKDKTCCKEDLLVEVSLLHSLLAPLECFSMLVLQRLQICHGPNALTF